MGGVAYPFRVEMLVCSCAEFFKMTSSALAKSEGSFIDLSASQTSGWRARIANTRTALTVCAARLVGMLACCCLSRHGCCDRGNEGQGDRCPETNSPDSFAPRHSQNGLMRTFRLFKKMRAVQFSERQPDNTFVDRFAVSCD